MTFATTGSQIIAEGVENQEEMDALPVLGVRLFQGYLIKRPTPIERAPHRHGPVPVGLRGRCRRRHKASRTRTADDCGRLRAAGRWGALFK